ncbi:MAG: glutamate synthase central domain-containing protein, partial [Arenicellales bacterium WSBS_2016_MAG_OTU3]
ISREAVDAVRNGATIIVLSDKNISREKLTVHALFATGAVHHKLIEEGLRCDANIIVKTGTARDPHHFAVLLGYGATAVYPYLAYECIVEMMRTGEIKQKDITPVLRAYRQGINKGLFKIMSKMGISTIASYRGAQLFEAVGLHESVIKRCFAGTVSRIQGARFEDFEADAIELNKFAWRASEPIATGGLFKYVHGGEYHAYHPDVIQTIHKAVASGDYEDYKEFAKLVNARPVAVIRDLLEIKSDRKAVSIADVEPIENILPRFDS